jgi:hypothetical protein
MNLNLWVARFTLALLTCTSMLPSTYAQERQPAFIFKDRGFAEAHKVAPRKLPAGGKLKPCEINFVKFLSGKLPAEVSGNTAVNLWDELFDADLLVDSISKMPKKSSQVMTIKELTRFVSKDKVFTQNLSDVVTKLHQKKILTYKEIEAMFLRDNFDNARFFWSHKTKTLTSQIDIDQSKIDLVERIIRDSRLPKNKAKEYRNILLQSNRTTDEINLALKNGMKLHNSNEHLDQFRKYIEFLDDAQKHKVKKGLKRIEDIYDFNFQHRITTLDPILPPHKQFLAQKSRLNSFEQRRYKKILKQYKLKEQNKITKEIDELAAREARGEVVSLAEKRRLMKKLDDTELPAALRKRAKRQAAGERSIYRKMLNGCNSGSSPRLASAAKKFSRFKFGLAMTSIPTFYLMKNWDKKDEDPHFWEKLGYEMFIGITFTFVANKLITNSQTSFLRKYVEGYVKFGTLDAVFNGFGYDQLFGAHAHIRHLQKLYRPDVPESKIEEELKKLTESPTFEEDVKELIDYLEAKSKEHNLKNTLNKWFNTGAYNSLDDDFRITREDLESEEAREALMELVAERLYLQNMGEWPIFQSGNHGADRWLFFRGRNVLWDLKGIALNLAMFQIMCREPFGKIGSWAAVIAMALGDQMFSGNLTYGLRREAINQ